MMADAGVRMGCWIMFRGIRRFVAAVTRSGLALERIQGDRSSCVLYAVTRKEFRALRVVTAPTEASRARGRRLMEKDCLPWTKIVWKGEEYEYVHDTNKFPPKDRT